MRNTLSDKKISRYFRLYYDKCKFKKLFINNQQKQKVKKVDGEILDCLKPSTFNKLKTQLEMIRHFILTLVSHAHNFPNSFTIESGWILEQSRKKEVKLIFQA